MNIKSEIPFDIPINEILLEAGIASKAKLLCAAYGRPHIVCDENTQDFVSLACEKTILPASQKADYGTALKIAEIDCDVFVAVGSGTINDITKYAAFKAGKPYIVFGSAASMNGYASGGASLLMHGHKQSFSAAPPHAIYLDTEILANAPKRLINAGIGDSVCRSTIENDNLLAHKLLGQTHYAEYFTLIKKYEAEIFDDIEALTKTLIFSGVAMLLAGSSAPASQGEHMLAHYMELMQPDAPQSFHGEQISVTTLTMAGLQNKFLKTAFNAKIADIQEDEIRQHYGAELADDFIVQIKKKYGKFKAANISPDEFIQIDVDALKKKLQAIDAPTSPSDIGWDQKIYDNAVKMAKFSRDRFTFLDLM